MLAEHLRFAYKRQLSFGTILSSAVLDLNTEHLSSNHLEDKLTQQLEARLLKQIAPRSTNY